MYFIIFHQSLTRVIFSTSLLLSLLSSLLFSLLFFILPLRAQADEKVGVLTLESVYLRPTFTSTEDLGGESSLSDSQFSLSWKKDKNTSAYVTVGSELNRTLPVYYATLPQDRLGFVEAYAEYKFVYGELRAGLIPLNFGYDGILKPSERYFNYSQPYTRRVIGSSDLGVSFYTENIGYYTQIIAHNGEIDTPSDGQLWVTGNWGYTNDRDLRVQLSLQTGYVDKEVSVGSTNTLAGVTNGQTARWRNGALFIDWYQRHWNVAVQLFGGELVQGEYKSRYKSNLIEVEHFFSKNFGVGLRYDVFDPNSKVSGDMKTETSLVFVAKSVDSTSALYILGTKSNEQTNEIPNDQLQIVWLLTPFSR